MKLFSKRQTRLARQNVFAFTLVEMMVCMGIYVSLCVAAMCAVQLFAMRIYTLSATKLTATGFARKAMGQVCDSIREAKTLQIGNCGIGASTFVAISGTNIAQGNALQLYPTTNQNAYTIFYLDTNSNPNNFSLIEFMTTNSGTNFTGGITLASYITNTIVFNAEDFQGNIVTNNTKNNQVYRMTLQFSQWEYPLASVGGGPGAAYDYYQIRTRVCRRALD